MSRRKKIIILIIIIALFLASIPIIDLDDIWEMLETVATIIGVFLIVFELKESKDLSEGSFVTSLTDSFNNNDSIQHIYKKLELNKIVEFPWLDTIMHM